MLAGRLDPGRWRRLFLAACQFAAALLMFALCPRPAQARSGLVTDHGDADTAQAA